MEKWKPIENSVYAVSSEGRVKNNKTNRILKQFSIWDGSKRITLRHEGVKKNHIVHRLVAEAFIENPFNKEEVDHINRNNSDNRVENLRWTTKEENLSNRLMLPKEVIKDIIKMHSEGKTIDEIFNYFG